MIIDWLDKSQHDAFVSLLCEHHSFHHPDKSHDRALVKQHLTERLLGEKSSSRYLIASNDNGELMGFAALSLKYSLSDPRPEYSRRCIVEEMFISDKHREAGLGMKLMNSAAKWAFEQGCSSMNWDVRSENVRGRRFYERLGGRIVEDRISYRISKNKIIALLDHS